MKTTDYKLLGNVGAAAVRRLLHPSGGQRCLISVNPESGYWEEDDTARTAFARAVVEEDRRQRMEEVGEGMPSVEEIGNLLEGSRSLHVRNDATAVRNLMLAAFESRLAEKDAEIEIFKQIRDGRLELQAKYDDLQVTMDSVTMNANWSIERMKEAEAKLAAAEKRLAEVAKLPEKWRRIKVRELDDPINVWTCAQQLDEAVKPAPTAEEVSRLEFEGWFQNLVLTFERNGSGEYIDPEARNLWAGWQARASKQEGRP